MTLYAFAVPNIVIEASSEESAVNKIAARLSTIARHLGNEIDLKDNDPFFTLTVVKSGDPVNVGHDPIIAARMAKEGKSYEATDIGEATITMIAANEGKTSK